MDVDQKSPNMPALSREPRPNPNTPASTVSDHRPYTHSVFHHVLLRLAQAVCLMIYTKWAILLCLLLMVIVEMILAEFCSQLCSGFVEHDMERVIIASL